MYHVYAIYGEFAYFVPNLAPVTSFSINTWVVSLHVQTEPVENIDRNKIRISKQEVFNLKIKY